jgi:hypothetical protein
VVFQHIVMMFSIMRVFVSEITPHLKAVRIEFFVYIKSCQYWMLYTNKMF